MKKTLIAVLASLGVAVLVLAQQPHLGTTIYHRPTAERGPGPLIGVGTEWPTASNAGHGPVDAELFINLDSNRETPATDPVFGIYSLNNGGWLAFGLSELVTNLREVANGVWFIEGGVRAEGATADAHEIVIDMTDATADIAYQFMADAADTYYVTYTPDGELTTSYFTIPPAFTHTEDGTLTSDGDNIMYVVRTYVPFPITVTKIAFLQVDLNALAAGDIAGVAIYEDADDGVNLTEKTSAGAAGLTQADVTDVTLKPGFYRFAFCTSDASEQGFHGTLQDDETIDLISGVTGDITFGRATNPCVTGDPPDTTGALVSDDVGIPVALYY